MHKAQCNHRHSIHGQVIMTQRCTLRPAVTVVVWKQKQTNCCGLRGLSSMIHHRLRRQVTEEVFMNWESSGAPR